MKVPSMIYPVVTAEEWSARYDLKIKEHTCTKCGLTRLADKPFATGRWRGLITPDHGCGYESDVCTAREFDEDGLDVWRQIMGPFASAAKEPSK